MEAAYQIQSSLLPEDNYQLGLDLEEPDKVEYAKEVMDTILSMPEQMIRANLPTPINGFVSLFDNLTKGTDKFNQCIGNLEKQIMSLENEDHPNQYWCQGTALIAKKIGREDLVERVAYKMINAV